MPFGQQYATLLCTDVKPAALANANVRCNPRESILFFFKFDCIYRVSCVNSLFSLVMMF